MTLGVNASGVMPDRYRLQFRFWLDANNDLESWLADQMSWLKSKRKFQPTLVTALRLYLSLLKGDVSVLHELFPWIGSQLQPPGGQPIQPAGRLKIEVEEEATIEVKAVKVGASKGFWNGLIAAAALNSSYNHLSPEILAYGIQIGRIPSHFAKQPVAAAATDGNSKVMSVPQFAVPSFDDEDDLDIEGGDQ